LQFDQQLSSADITKIGSSGGIDFYVVTAENQSDYQVKELYGVIGGAYASAYLPVDPLSSSSAPGIAWTQNTPDSQPVSNTNTYTSAAAGCGSAYGYVIAKNIDPSQLVKAGVGPASETIYQLPTSSSLFSDYYTNNYGGGSGLQDSTLQNLSLSDFQADHAVILAKNSLGEYVVYQRTDMFEGGGCGKPVIYLYPEAPTDVNVKIGADVTASDPTYGQDGWNDVLALPGGKLIYQDKSYNSLFWEGIGLGSYPQINSGTVVPSAAAVSTIKKQLSEQGFSGSEISDFLAYWQPKLPNTPYVRLTWFNTSQMNQLAPLDITPKPTTLIRTFLDFQGLEKPISLSPQTFHAPERQGFTVVEWGGLLRTN
jgi:hypothetical protein